MRFEGPGAAAVQPVITLAIAFVVVLLLMWWGWRRHAKRDQDVQAPDFAPVEHPVLGPLEAVYVSSTRAGDPLARIHSHTLGARSVARVSVDNRGTVAIERVGARSFSIPADAIVAVKESSGQAGKYTGRSGLVVITWRSGEPLVDTGLRLARRADHALLISHLSPRLEEAP